MHSYGSWPDKYFNQVEDAASDIGTFIAQWGRMTVLQTKEKFGTVRVYCSFGFSCIHGLIWPRRCWIHKWWPYKLDLFITWQIRKIIPLVRLVNKYQEFIYRLGYKRAVKKYPHLVTEILVMADAGELLNGIAGYKHSDHWKEVK